MEKVAINPKKNIRNLLFKNIVGIFFVNVVASLFYWYYTIWWFDMPMHFWGGTFILFGTVYLFYIFYRGTQNSILVISINKIVSILFISFLVYLLWEVFEYMVNEYTQSLIISPLDSVSDIFFDLSGGIFALIYLVKNKLIVLVSKDESDIINSNG